MVITCLQILVFHGEHKPVQFLRYGAYEYDTLISQQIFELN